MTLPDFIAEVGDQKAAELFRAPVRTVQSWRRRERYPRPSTAQQIIGATGGRVTMQGIYAPLADGASAPAEHGEVR